MAPLSLSAVESSLQTTWIGRAPLGANELWDTIDSTNTRAKELAAQGAPNGTLILARKQTAGRGRLGRIWESPLDAGVYMTLLLRPQEKPIYEMPLLTIAAGVAAARAIEQVASVRIGLKWVNDMVLDGRKLGGILAESSGALAPYVVLGMGINLKLETANLADELKSKVASLHEFAKDEIDPSRLAATIWSQFEQLWQPLQSGQCQQILGAWRDYSVTIGQKIRATIGEKTLEGLAVDVTDSGALKVIQDDGTVIELTAGEIQIRTAGGAYC
ncbi:MAG TPA: biotin--[acetyl-CoA-carboxylase] ligase [Oculatellaceae cyanobacterium]